MRRSMFPAILMAVAPASVPAMAQYAANPADASAWAIEYSPGMPPAPTQGRRGWFFEFPYPSVGAGHAHYVTFNHGPLTGKSRIVMRYRVDAGRGVRFVPRENPAIPATISLYFQRRGDRWTGRGKYDAYRWFAPNPTVMNLTPGEHVMTVSLRDNWGSVSGVSAAANPFGFQGAIADADRVGFLLGSHAGRGHGVYATGPARLTVISFQVL